MADIAKCLVTFHHSTLAEAPGSEEITKVRLLEALKELKELPEIDQLGKTYRSLEQTYAKASQMAERIKLVGLIPGHCEVCRRLGL